ncbi:hypothetical protein ACFLXE_07260 [Chloroflexota bacterium]
MKNIIARVARTFSLGSILGKTSSLPPRLSLIIFALPLQMLAESLYWIYGRPGNISIIVFTISLWLVWFSLVFSTAIPAVDRVLHYYRRRLHLAAVAIIVLLAFVGIGEAVGIHLVNTGVVAKEELPVDLAKATERFRYNDATALGHQASEELLNGENPYANANMVAVLEEMELPAEAVTPLKQGDFTEVFPFPTEAQLDEVVSEAKASNNTQPVEFESKISYPAGSFLFHTPFIALGLQDLRIFYLLCAIAIGAIIFWRAPSQLRPLVVAAFLASLVLWNLVATGTNDTLYVLFILVGWMLRSRLWLAALFMGLAASTKQVAWFYILFYLILVLRETGWRPVFQSAVGIVTVFLAVNLPFILGAPQHWLEGVLGPMADPLFPKGVGLVTLSVAGILPQNALLFVILEIVVLISAAIWYYRTGYRYPQVGLLLAVLPLFFAWRSFSFYLYFSSILVFGSVVVLEYGKSIRRTVPQRRSHPRSIRVASG